tara:strand:- start:47 stop:514 length:468 start_codon:yes stop_codon:yes gene_type:complete
MPVNSNLSQFSQELTQTISQIWRLSRAMLKNKADPFVKGLLTFPQYIALDFLSSAGSLKMKDLAKALHVSLPAATGLVSRLVSMKMVKRKLDSSDRRVIYIEITKVGQKGVENVKSARKKMIEQIFANLSDSERRTYLKIIRKVRKNLYEKEDKI